MKTKSKILLAIVLSIFIIGTITTTVVFAGLADMESGSGQNQIGKAYKYSLNTLEGSINTYCIQHSGHLSRHYSVTGYVKAYISIDGRKANIYINKDGNPKTMTCDLNAQIAYILSKKQGYGTLNNKSVAQVVLWRNMNSWINKLAGAFDSEKNKNVFLQFKDNANSRGGSYGTNCKALKKEAQDYAESLTAQSSGEEKVTLSITDKTDAENLSVGDTADYIRVGPFQYKFTGDLQELKVKCDGDYLSDSDFRFIKYRGSKAQVIKASDIKSKDVFYVDVSKKVDIKNTIGLKIKVGTSVNNKDVIKARVWLIKAGSYQNILHCTTSKTDIEPESKDAFFNYSIPSLSAKIKKVDDRDETKVLKDVGFTFSTTIKTYDCVSSEDQYGWVTHGSDWVSGYYKNVTDEDGKVTKEWVPGHYANTWDEWEVVWTKNFYLWQEHTVYLDESGKWTYSPYIWRTDKKGEIPLDNISYNTISTKVTNETYNGESKTVDGIYLDKTYIIATEVDNPYYGFQNEENHQYKVEVGTEGKVATAKLTNHQQYVKLSGYVWLDEGDGKITEKNDEFDYDFEKGIEKTGKDGVKVYLKDKNGNIVKREIKDEQGNITAYVDQVTETSEVSETNSKYKGKDLYPEIDGGEYIFEDVNLDKLEEGEYHVEFEYCGILYQAVTSNVEIKNGSKAEETNSRDILDKKFASVDSNNGQQELNLNGVKVGYNDISNHESTPKGHKEGHYGCEVYASTKTGDFEYKLDTNFNATDEEIRYINLGLYEKAQTEYALVQDLYHVRVAVNGFNHVYKYGSDIHDGDDIKEDAWNVGVKFQNDKGTYNRAIYKADSEYEAKNHKDNELKVYATYEIAIKNQSSYLGRINSIVDYCDNNYNLIAAGTKIDDNDNVTDQINIDNISKTSYDNKYSKYVIDINQEFYSKETVVLYLQFEMNREAVLTILNNKELLNNVTEINSYSTFYDNDENKPIAVIDTRSVPGNAKPGNIDTYENDTAGARSLKLEPRDDRTVNGTVFVDNPEGLDNPDGVNAEKERKGNGIFDNGEKTLSGVTVTLREIGKDDSSYDGERKVYTATTDENGNFKIVGYIPGNYILTYTWGDKDHMVQYYKGTIYDSTRNQGDPYWYRGSEYNNDTISIEKRATDALDDYATREAIEEEMRGVTINTLEQQIKEAYVDGYNSEGKAIKTTKMNSSTPAIQFSVEYITTITDGNDDKVEFAVKNVDFGIVERAKQALDLRKRITGYKITLANGQVLVDAEIDENGNLKGIHEHTTYLKPTVQSGIINIGQLKTEMDNELIEGATLETTYEMKVTNVGELDYSTKDYYYYGIPDNNKKITVSVSELLDYVDGRLNNLDPHKEWKETDQDHLKDVNASKKEADDINKYRTYLTDKLVAKPLTPGESNTVNLYTSKLLTSTDDNTFNNESEISQVIKNDGFTIGTPIELTWNADKTRYSFNIADSEKIEIIPSTGQNKNYILPTIIGITAITILGVGIILIKKFVIDKK